MKKTGELLKQKRESSELSISEVALATKINPKILTAIESGDEAALPAKTFLKGFVRSYALFLKMDVDEVMRSFQDETGGAPQPTVHEAYQKPPEGAPAAPAKRSKVDHEASSTLRTAAVVVIVLLIGLIIGVRELIEKYQKEKVVATNEVKVTPLVTPPVEPQPAAPKAEEPAPAAAEPAPPVAKVEEPAKKEEPPKKEEPKKEEPKVIAGIPPGLAAPKEEPKAAEPTPTSAPAPKEDRQPTESVQTPPGPRTKAGKYEVILEALDNVEVQFEVKGKPKRLALGPTQVHTIQTDDPMKLEVSDGGALNIIVNGRERGPVGPLGKAKQVTIP